MLNSWKMACATVIGAIAAFSAAGARDSAAALITYNFAGTVSSVDVNLTSQFGNGNTLSGSFTFESTTAALGGSTTITAVFNALTSLNFAVNGYTASTTGAPELQIGNKDGVAELTDRFAAVSRASDGLTGANVNGASLNAFILRLDDSSGSVFSSALNLPTNISLADFDGSSFFLFFQQNNDLSVVAGTLSSFGVSTGVPEPATLAILGVALLGIGVMSRCRKRTA